MISNLHWKWNYSKRSIRAWLLIFWFNYNRIKSSWNCYYLFVIIYLTIEWNGIIKDNKKQLRMSNYPSYNDFNPTKWWSYQLIQKIRCRRMYDLSD